MTYLKWQKMDHEWAKCISKFNVMDYGGNNNNNNKQAQI